ncbi:MAG TPA: AI-2E family transporter [Marinagarivorans sp.]
MSTSPVVRFLFGAACFVIVVAGMRTAETLLVPFLLSLFISVLCSPPLLWLKERGVPNGIAIFVIIAVVVIVSLAIGTIVGAAIGNFRHDLPEYQARLTALTAGLFTKLQALGLNVEVSQLRDGFNPSAVLGFAGSALANLGNLMTNAFLILLTVVFILAEEVGFSDKIKLASANYQKTLEALNRFKVVVNRYMAIKTGLSLLTGVLIMGWLWALGVDYFVLWGLLAFLLNFIPTLGSILAAVPAVLLALVQLGVGDAVLTAVGFVFVNVVIGNIVEPRMMGKGLDLSALVVFLSLVFWGWVLGSIGMLLSIPLTMTVKIALESFDETRWVGVMLGSGSMASRIASGAENTDIALPQMPDDSTKSS